MGGLGIAFRRRTQYKKKVEKLEIDIYDSLKLSDGAQMLLGGLLFADHVIQMRASFNAAKNTNLSGIGVSGQRYDLAGVNNTNYLKFSNGATSATQKYLYGNTTARTYEWDMQGISYDGTSLITQARTPQDWTLQIENSTTIYSLDIYDSTGSNLLHSLKPALINKETPGLWDEVNQKFYGMTSEIGTLTLA